MVLAWLTPENTPVGMVCFRVYCPDDEISIWNLQGALSQFSNPARHEDIFGNVSADEIAQIWSEINLLNLPLRGACMFVGTVFYTARSTVPDGCLLCDGAQHLIADYPLLYDAIGTIYGGTGDYFNVPDLTDKFILSTDDENVVGDTGGEAEHTLTIGEMPAHTHGLFEQVAQAQTAGTQPYKKYTGVVQLQTDTAGGGEAHNNMPPYIKLLPCIVTQ